MPKNAKKLTANPQKRLSALSGWIGGQNCLRPILSAHFYAYLNNHYLTDITYLCKVKILS